MISHDNLDESSQGKIAANTVNDSIPHTTLKINGWNQDFMHEESHSPDRNHDTNTECQSKRVMSKSMNKLLNLSEKR